MSKLKLHHVLYGLTLTSVFCMFVTSNDPLPAWAEGTILETVFTQPSTGNQITFDLSVGLITSVLMYLLIVRGPEQAKRHRIKANLQKTYAAFRQQCVSIFLGSMNGSYSLSLRDDLCKPAAFKAFFNELHSEDQRRWHAVANGLDRRAMQALLIEMEILTNEFHFALSSIDVDDPQAFAFFKRTSQIMYRMRNHVSADYDDQKSVMKFMWDVHANWNNVDEQLESDPIEQMIAAL